MLAYITHLPPLATIVVVLLILGATLRLTRFIVSDSLGGWLTAPIVRWASDKEMARRDAIRTLGNETSAEEMTDAAIVALDRMVASLHSSDPITWQARLASGLGCPFCVGFWIGLAITIITLLLAPLGLLGVIWLVLLFALTLNYIAAHIGAKID